jgi:hypothetical protein
MVMLCCSFSCAATATASAADVAVTVEDLVFDKAMLWQIINNNKTEILLDGRKTRVNLPLANWLVVKLSLECTGIFGSHVAGECMPLHWQLLISVTEAERERIRVDFLMHIQSTHRWFSFEEERVFPAMIGMKEEEGMTNDGFDRYIENSIIPLFPIWWMGQENG